MARNPNDAAGHFWAALTMGNYSLGLGIVQDLAAAWGGELEIRRGVLGGCCVQLRLPSAPPAAERRPGGDP